MNERYIGEKRSQRQPILIMGDSSIVPVAGENETFPIVLSPFMDHGRPAFITSTIKTNATLVETAKELTAEESMRLNNGANKILEEILDGHPIKGTAVLTSTEKGKPDIYVATFGSTFNPTGLRLYFHHGVHDGAKVLYLDARTRIKDSGKVERVFRQAGYSSPKAWGGNKKIS